MTPAELHRQLDALDRVLCDLSPDQVSAIVDFVDRLAADWLVKNDELETWRRAHALREDWFVKCSMRSPN